MAAATGLSPIESEDGNKDMPLSVSALPGPPIKGDSILDLRLVYYLSILSVMCY